MLDRVPTVRARQVGQELQRAVHGTGRSSSEIAKQLGWSPSKVSRLLTGKRIGRPVDTAALLAVCGVVGERREEVLDLAADPYTSTWWCDYGSRLPVHRPALTDNEGAATAITCFDNAFVPDLLRTPAYTRALLGVLPNVPAVEIEARVAELTRRQLVLERTFPPEIRVFVDEYVLTRTGAGDDVMSGQAHHLLRMAVRPSVRIRVVPEAAALRNTTPFTLLEYAELPPVAHIELPTSEAFLEREDTIAAYRRVIAELDRRALDEADSRAWLADVARRRAGEDLAKLIDDADGDPAPADRKAGS